MCTKNCMITQNRFIEQIYTLYNTCALYFGQHSTWILKVKIYIKNGLCKYCKFRNVQWKWHYTNRTSSLKSGYVQSELVNQLISKRGVRFSLYYMQPHANKNKTQKQIINVPVFLNCLSYLLNDEVNSLAIDVFSF